jgi:transposase-like protein
MAESIRKQLIIKLLEEGNLSVKQIAEKVDCTAGYIYNVRSEWMLEQAQKGSVKMRELNNQIETIIKPKRFSHNWEPKWWEMLAMTTVAALAIYFCLIVVMSF